LEEIRRSGGQEVRRSGDQEVRLIRTIVEPWIRTGIHLFPFSWFGIPKLSAEEVFFST